MTKLHARETRELRIRRGVIERLQFLLESACSNVQVVDDVVAYGREFQMCGAL